jgi:hypothetical protein
MATQKGTVFNFNTVDEERFFLKFVLTRYNTDNLASLRIADVLDWKIETPPLGNPKVTLRVKPDSLEIQQILTDDDIMQLPTNVGTTRPFPKPVSHMPTVDRSKDQKARSLAARYYNRHSRKHGEITRSSGDVFQHNCDTRRNVHSKTGDAKNTYYMEVSFTDGEGASFFLEESEAAAYYAALQMANPKKAAPALVVKHDITLADIGHIALQPGKAYALKCSCTTSSEDMWFCEKILDAYESGTDWDLWNDVPKIGTKEIRSGFNLAVPIFGKILHRVFLVKEDIISWDEIVKKHYKVNMHSHAFTDYLFFDWNDKEIAKKVILILQSLIADDPKAAELALSFDLNPLPVEVPQICSNSHTFGTNQRHKELTTVGLPKDERARNIAAAIFTLLTYQLCLVCYRNTEPSFSLINL